jgi:hypothetical protein
VSSPGRSSALAPTESGCANARTLTKSALYRFGISGIVYSNGYAYAVRYVPNTVVTEELMRKSWRENRRGFRPYNDSTDEIIY